VTQANFKIASTVGDPESGLTYQAEDDPKNGTVVVNPDGSYVYTPTPNFVGQDVFTYRAFDAEAPTRFRIASVIVLVQPKVKLVAVNDTYYMKVGQKTQVVNPLARDSGSQIKISSVAKKSVGGGTVTVTAAGKIIYKPKASFAGRDTFKYVIVDSNGLKATATQIIFVPAMK
ncbi:MAG: cadherin-like domain-containing protein, partial [Rhodoluna sp.]|nr:cadherin-like domain-containing protein [Rhodoluna sp.]